MRLSINSEFARWQIAIVTGKIGKISLLISVVPFCLLVVWLSIFAPQTALQKEELSRAQSQLQPLQLLNSQKTNLKDQVTVSEYQQIRLIFEQLQKNNLRIEASRYQLVKQDSAQTLLLNIPLQGEYLPLAEALEMLCRMLPLQIEQITLQRSSPLVSRLNVSLLLRLKKETQ